LALGAVEEVGVELARSDGEGLLVELGVDQRADVLEDALLDLVVVRVDLPGALRGEDHEGVLGRRPVEELVDRRVGDADGSVVQRGGRCVFDGGHYGVLLWTCGEGLSVRRCRSRPTSNDTNSSTAASSSSLTTTSSNTSRASISTFAVSRRRATTSCGSVPRPRRRTSSSSHEGGDRKTVRPSGIDSRICRTPARSTSMRTGRPSERARRTGSAGVPDSWRPRWISA